MLGYINSKIIWSDLKARWEIHNLVQNQLVAFNNDKGFPIGVHQWIFPNSSCKGAALNYKGTILFFLY